MNTATLNFTLDDVMSKVREVAAERPDYVYNNGTEQDGSYNSTVCYYRHNREEGVGDGAAGCIVGQALDRLGYVVPAEHEGTHSTGLLEAVLHADYWSQNKDARNQLDWIRKVQSEQDRQRSWGEAVQSADEAFPAKLYPNLPRA